MLAAKEQLAAQASEIRALPGDVRAFVEVLEPPLRLLICGAGHDAIPMVKAAAALGWNPLVVDDAGFLTRDRYPEAAGFVQVEEPDDAAKVATTDERTFVVVMTHNFLRDKAYLRSFLAAPRRLHRDARARGTHATPADGAGGGGRDGHG